MKIVFRSVLGCFICLVTCQAAAISGRVVDLAGYPIPDAEVLLVSTYAARNTLSTITNGDGRYEFPLVPSGAYTIEANCKGFLRLRYDPIVVRYPNSLNLNFVLPFDWNTVIINKIEGMEARVSGELRNGDSPLSEAEICLETDQTRRCVRTNEIGQYFLQVEPGEYRVSIFDGANIIGKQAIQLIKPGDYWNVISLISTTNRR